MKFRYPDEKAVSKVSMYMSGLRKYVLVGVIATGVDWALFSVFVFIMDLHYLLAGTVSFLVATFAGYLSGLRLLFRGGRHQRWVEITFVYVASLLGLAIHLGVLAALVDGLQMHIFLAKTVATAATFLWNFTARYFWIFEKDTSNV